MQLELALRVPSSVASHQNLFGTGIAAHVFGKDFPWRVSNYNDFSTAAPLFEPYMNAYGLERAIVPDFRGMNGTIVEPTPNRLTTMHGRKADYLNKTNAAVDGVALRKGLAVFGITADCPLVILADTLRHNAYLLHCGCDALHSHRRDGSMRDGESSVIHAAMRALMPTNVDEVRAAILCGIGPQSYFIRSTHKKHGDFYKKIAEHFRPTGAVSGAVGEERLNLAQVIRSQLNEWGVGKYNPSAIWSDGIDTFADDRLYSRRREADGCNCVLVDTTKATLPAAA